MKIGPHLRYRASSLALALSLLAPPVIVAQSVSSTQTAPGETVELPVFEVRTDLDTGYRSVFSSAGSLVAEELRNVPSPISVINRELINDIGAINIFDISRYAVGGEHTAHPENDTQFYYRGMSSSWQTRNFFIWYLPTDSFSIERTEILRGPNALLYGDAEAGGLMNIVTKRAQPSNFSHLRLTVGSWERYRAHLDVNRQITKDLDFRFNGVVSRSKDFRDFRYDNFDGVHFAVTYRPLPQTRIRAEAEWGNVDRNTGSLIFRDTYSNFNPAVSATAGTSLRTGNTNNYYISYNNRTIERYGSAGFRISTGSNEVIDEGHRLYGVAPDEWQFNGPSPYIDRDYSQWSVTIEQGIGENFTLEATLNKQNNHNHWLRFGGTNIVVVDAQPTLPNGATNPHYGDPFVDTQYTLQEITNFVTDYRLAATYKLDLPFGISQRLLGFWTYRADDFVGKVQNERAIENLNVDVRRRVYLEDYDSRDLSFSLLPNTTRWFGSGFHGANVNKLEATSFVAMGSYWDGRLRSMIGYRRDIWDVERRARLDVPVTSNGITVTERMGFSATTTEDPTIKDDSLNYGGVYHFLRNFNGVTASLVANYSESFRPTGNLYDVFGDSIAPVKGKGKEGGLRLEALGGKVALTTTVFTIDVENNNVAVSDGVRNEIMTLFPNSGVIPASGSIGGGGDTRSLTSEGYEIELAVNPRPGWTLTANYSHADLSQTNIYPRVKPFWDQAKSQGLDPTTYSQLNTFVGNAVNDSQLVVPERDKIFNVFTRYKFLGGSLKNFAIGGGVNYRSPAYLTVLNGVTTYSPDYLVWNGLIGYNTKIMGKQVNFTLNINNMTDEKSYIAYSYGGGQWTTPREFRLTAEVKF